MKICGPGTPRKASPPVARSKAQRQQPLAPVPDSSLFSSMRSDSHGRLTPVQRRIAGRIRALHDAGEALNIAAVKRRHPGLIKRVCALRPYWGWKAALAAAGLAYRDVALRLQETVTCRICGAEKLTLVQHLARTHEVDCDDYLTDYPDADLTSEAYRAGMMGRSSTKGGTSRRLMPHWERPWTPEYVLDRIAELNRRGMSLHHSWVEDREVSLIRMAEKFFGDWDEALRRIGLDPRRVRLVLPHVWWTKDIVAAELKRLHRAGLGMMRQDIQAAGHRPLCLAAVRLFGSHEAALQAAGIDPVHVRHRTPKKYGVADKRRLHAALRKAARLKSPDARDRAVRALRQDFASMVSCLYGAECWGAVALDAGVDPERVSPLKGAYPTEHKVVSEIRRRHRQGLPINSGAVQKREGDLPLYRRGVALFGSWDAALEAAGFRHNSVRLRRRSPYDAPEKTLAAIRRSAHAGRPIWPATVRRDHPLLDASVRRFYGTWRRALAASGASFRMRAARS